MTVRKAMDDRPLRLIVLHTVPQDSFAEDLVSEVVGAVTQQGEVEVAHFDVPSMKLYDCPGCQDDGSAAPCRVNDIDSKRYKADDQFLDVFDKFQRADMVLISATVKAGGANAEAQRVMERLNCAHNRKPRAFLNKALGVVVASKESDVWSIAARIVAHLNGYGMSIPGYGTLVLTSAGRPVTDDETHDDESTSDVTSDVVDDILLNRDTQEAITRLGRGLIEMAKANGRT